MRDRSVLHSSAQETLAESSEPGGYTVFVGGFPCQDLSVAGQQKGLSGERSGLVVEYFRLINECRPDWIVTENVAHTWRKWVPNLRRDLHGMGYASLPLRVRASDLGAPHERARVFLIAHSNSEQLRIFSRWWIRQGRQMADVIADNGEEESLANSPGIGSRKRAIKDQGPRRQDNSLRKGWWKTEPDVDRVVDGFPTRVDRVRSLGNAIIPQIAEIIATGIKEVMKERGDG